jgi:hypothetical protein
MSDLLEYYPLSLKPMANPAVDWGEHHVLDAQSAHVFRIHGDREKAEAIVSILNERASGAPAQTSGEAARLADRIELAKVALIIESRDDDGEYETTEYLEPDDRYLIAQALRALPQVTEGMRAPSAAAAHASDCAIHNGPALPTGPCDCGVGCGTPGCTDPNCAYGSGIPRCQKCGTPIPPPVAASVVEMIEKIIYENASISHFDNESEVDNAAYLAREICAALTAARDTEGKQL